MTEEWRPISGFPNYAVSSFGRVMRVGGGRYRPSGRPLKSRPAPNGYVLASLHEDGKQTTRTVHSIVCETFHGPRPSPDHQVAHGDGVRNNNMTANLRWATRQENMGDCVGHGTRYFGDDHPNRLRPDRMARGERNGGGGKLTAANVRAIRADRRLHREIAADFGVVKSMVAMIKRREAWKHIA